MSKGKVLLKKLLCANGSYILANGTIVLVEEDYSDGAWFIIPITEPTQ